MKPIRTQGFIQNVLVLAGAIFLPVFASANNPGGFTTLVTTAVTTGTETFNGHTDHFLDNGILRAEITSSGSVESLKYLKPGTVGTPKANGTETVSQSGVNFGNHTAIYYYWYPDGNGDCVYLNTTTGGTNTDIVYATASASGVCLRLHHRLNIQSKKLAKI
jgi:hypothetical protein